MRGAGLRRLRAVLRKERLQILRDPSSILLAIVMPVVMLFLFGFGVSLEAGRVPLALVVDAPGPAARDLVARVTLSRWFAPTRATSMREAVTMLREGRVDGILRVRSEFTEAAATAGRPPVQLVLDAVDSNRAQLVLGYVRGAVGRGVAIERTRRAQPPPGGVVLESRIRFNEAVDSTHSLIPGLLTLVMTLIGVLLTALVIAREWERGTMEGLLATPLRTRELLLGKLLPYLGLGLLGMLLSVGLGITLFGVPFRGSFGALLLTGTLFLLASLGLGLFISAAVRIQFVAAQISIVVGFLPAFFLSGLIFDLGSTPLPVRILSRVIPATHFVAISQTLFLAGDVPEVLLSHGAVLAGMALVLIVAARSRLGLRLERGHP